MLLAGKKVESLQKDVLTVILSVISLPYTDMHPIWHHLEAGLNKCMFF